MKTRTPELATPALGRKPYLSRISLPTIATPPGESWAEMWQHPFDWAKFDGGAP
jgi:hypothetical protein